MTEPPPPHPTIRASELGEYAYCRRAWWLRRVQGAESENLPALELGQARHAAHGRLVTWAGRLERLALILLVVAALTGALILVRG